MPKALSSESRTAPIKHLQLIDLVSDSKDPAAAVLTVSIDGSEEAFVVDRKLLSDWITSNRHKILGAELRRTAVKVGDVEHFLRELGKLISEYYPPQGEDK